MSAAAAAEERASVERRGRRLAGLLRRGEIAAASPQTQTKCDDPYGPCGALTLGTSYRCAYYVTEDDSGELHYENRRQTIECIAKAWLETGVSPHSGRRIVSVMFDDSHCDVAVAEGSAAAVPAADPNSRIVGREDLVAALLVGDPPDTRATHAEWLESLDTKRLCSLAKERMAETYQQLKGQIQEWAEGTARSLSNDDLRTVAGLLNVQVTEEALSGSDPASRKLAAVEMLAKVAGMQPKGYAAWARWFGRAVRHHTFRAVSFFQRHKAGTAGAALVVLASLCLLGGCAAMTAVVPALRLAAQHVQPVIAAASPYVAGASEAVDQYNRAAEYAGYVAAAPDILRAGIASARAKLSRRASSAPSRSASSSDVRRSLSLPSARHSDRHRRSVSDQSRSDLDSSASESAA
jgi:hypothetical protein